MYFKTILTELLVYGSQLSACPTSRVFVDAPISQGATIFSDAISASSGDRVLARSTGTSSLNVDLFVIRESDSQIVAASQTSNSKEFIDFYAPSNDSYKIKISAITGSGTVHATFDRSIGTSCGAVSTPVDTCFGAVGSNCDGVPILSYCSDKADGLRECQVSVGSEMHDTCCSFPSNFNGKNCGGDGSQPTLCSKEWDHAWNDTGTTRQWPVTFNPTVVRYRTAGTQLAITVLLPNGSATSYPTSIGLKTPSGKSIWDEDAFRGWCLSGSYVRKWSWQGWYATCN